MRRLVIVAMLVTTLNTAVTRADDELQLRNCLLAGATFDAPASKVYGTYVPKTYRLGDWATPGNASLIVWTFDCESGRTSDGVLGRVGLAFVGVHVQQRPPSNYPSRLIPYTMDGLAGHPDRPLSPHPLGNGANLWDIYVNVVLSNDEVVAEYLGAWGLPAQHADLTVHPQGLRSSLETWRRVASVGWRDAAFETSVGPVLSDVTHFHDNVLYFGPEPAGAVTATITIPYATDHFCGRMPDCATATASGWMSDFLGGRQRSDPTLAFDHARIDQVRIGP